MKKNIAVLVGGYSSSTSNKLSNKTCLNTLKRDAESRFYVSINNNPM